MPREGTKTALIVFLTSSSCKIEIRYAPGGDENGLLTIFTAIQYFIEIRYAPGGDENSIFCIGDGGVM